MHESACAEEQRHFDDAVEQHVEQSALQSPGSEEQDPEEHVGKIADRGPCEPSFEMALLQCHAGGIDDGEAHRSETDLLHEGLLQESRTVDIPGDPRNSEDAGIHHRHCVKKRGHRGGRRRCQRQPSAEREHCRLRAEAEETEEKCKKQHLPHPFRTDPRKTAGDRRRPQTSAESEVPAAGKKCRQHHREKCCCRSANGEGRVDTAGEHALMVSVVHYQRQRHQGEHFVKHVQGGHVPCKSDPQGDAVGHHIKSEESILPLLFLHVLEGIEKDRRPHD